MVKKTIFYILVVSPLLAASLVTATVYLFLTSPYEGPEKQFVISPGESFSKINYRLEKESVIFSAKLFYYLAKYKKNIGRLKAGSFTIKSGMDSFDVMETLVNSSPHLIKVTIPEGKNLYEIGSLLEQKNILKKDLFIKEAKKTNYLDIFEIPHNLNLEGHLFPDTYKFAKGVGASQVVSALVNNFKNKTKDLNLSAHPSLSPFQLITLASIVEKETGAAFERPIIAGVFHNRLKKKMRLQSDPTTIYGIWDSYKGNLKKKHLLEKTPYNTYKIPSLPIGPIANPSLQAIKAVLSPQKHNYLYFVSKNDGTHIFTRNYQEHLKAVEKWQKTRRNRKGKSWRDLKQKAK
ncbi:endolytic transglycosylase MltG [Bacteriovoracaceae bacterium]|nr:endolytic transglycosylase MltG [Bacteriovoracaceae bacterium]